jgi:hypothetical protein
MKSHCFTLLKYIAIVLSTVAGPIAFAAPQTATLSFSTPQVSGSFGLNFETSRPTEIRITSVSLTIDGYKYKPRDVVYKYDPIEDVCYIGGIAFGGDTLDEDTRDFYLAWKPAPPGGSVEDGFFVYVSSDIQGPLPDFAVVTIVPGRQKGKPNP